MRIRLFILLFLFSIITNAQSPGKYKIQLAILLDVSSSMDLLISQTSAQLWSIADYLNTGTKKRQKIELEFALITYGGSDGYTYQPMAGYTHINSYFTMEIDSLASQLSQIETSGGEEYCYAAIDRALNNLNWSSRKSDLRIIVIAGQRIIRPG